ncbi:MAG: hypothetical protein GX629_09710 [Phycisphaerae bacterium]|nr:hypothetical protein [Phycisphaerae bacterium]
MNLKRSFWYYQLILFVSFLTPAALASDAAKFEWEGTRYGIEKDVVPSPWKPIVVNRINKNTLQVVLTEKTLLFKGSVLPTQIQTIGQNILAKPMYLEVDTFKSGMESSTVEILEKTSRRVVLGGTLSLGTTKIKARCTIEFDGLCCLSFEPLVGQERRNVELFRLTVPIKRQYASLGKVGGMVGEIPNVGAEKSWAFPFWVGWEEGGLTMFTESDRWWVNPNPKMAFRVKPMGTQTDIQTTFISAKTVFKQESRFEVYFQPTPMKTFPTQRQELGMLHCAFPDMDLLPATVNVTYPAEGNIDLDEGTMDLIWAPAFDPQAKREKRLGNEPYVRELFVMNVLGTDLIRVCWSVAHGGIIVDDGIQPESEFIWDVTRRVLICAKLDWKQDQFHRLTLTWGKKELKLYADGVLVGRSPRSGLLRENPDGSIYGPLKIRLGESSYNLLTPRFGKGIVVDELRILDHEIKTGLDTHKLEKVKGTLLLERFDSTQSSREVLISSPVVGSGGIVSKGGAIVKTPSGNGACLFQEGDKIDTCLDRVREMGVRTVVYHQDWAKIQSHYIPEDADALQRLVDHCHKNDMKILLYFGFQLCEKADEWNAWHRKALRLNPDEPTPPLQQIRPDQKCLNVCYASEDWQDFITFGVERSFKRFGIDGIYIDAALVPYPCQNYLHGCGWRSGDNKVHATLPVYRHVEMIRRIYNIVKDHDGFVTCNQALNPLAAYLDSIWIGEGYKYKELGQDPVSAIPLSHWRATYRGNNQGTPNELLMYEYPPKWNRDAAHAMAGLHDMFVRPETWWKGAYLEKLAKLWQAYRSFGIDSADFTGYWADDTKIDVSPSTVKASYWKKQGEILLWISNLSEQPTVARVRITAFPEGQDIRCVDTIYDKTYSVEKGVLEVPVGAVNWRLVHLSVGTKQQ